MKLAFILFRYFPFGGLQRDFLRIAQTCLQRGHSVHVFTMRWDAPPEPGLPVTLVPVTGLQNHSRLKSFTNALPALLAPEQFDKIIGFNKMPGLDFYYAADTCFQAKARREHNALFRLLPRYRTLLALENAVFEACHRTQIFLLSQRQQQEFTHFYATPSERFHLLPPGIARDRIAPVGPKKSTQADSHHVLFIGSGFRTKGLDRVINALAALPHALRQKTRLSVIGSDNPRAYLKEAKRLGISHHIDFLGGRLDVPHFLHTADLLIHPARNENTGTVLLEALAAGLPVLTTDVCGYAHYIETAEAGTVLVSPFQQADLNAALETMLSSADRSLWRTHALDFARHADIYSLPERAADLIESLPT